MYRPRIRCRPPRLLPTHLSRRYATDSPFPRVVGTGEARPSTPIAPPPLPWYRQPPFLRKCVNIMLLAFFVNSTALILSYKSLERELAWQSKERIRTLRETIEKVRKGEPIDIRAALGTGDPESEKKWEDVLREIVEQERIWQEKADSQSPLSSKPDNEKFSRK